MINNSQYTERKIQENQFRGHIGTVASVTARDGSADRPTNHDVNVYVDEETEFRNVPILSGVKGEISIPQKNDAVLVEFLDNKGQSPVVTDIIYTAQDRAPLGRPGDYRMRMFDEAEFEIYKNNSGQTIVSMTRQPTDGEDPDMGVELNLTNGEFKIGDGDGYGIESDGSGNFTWHHENVNFSKGTTMDWSRPGPSPK